MHPKTTSGSKGRGWMCPKTIFGSEGRGCTRSSWPEGCSGPCPCRRHRRRARGARDARRAQRSRELLPAHSCLLAGRADKTLPQIQTHSSGEAKGGTPRTESSMPRDFFGGSLLCHHLSNPCVTPCHLQQLHTMLPCTGQPPPRSVLPQELPGHPFAPCTHPSDPHKGARPPRVTPFRTASAQHHAQELCGTSRAPPTPVPCPTAAVGLGSPLVSTITSRLTAAYLFRAQH